MMSKYGELSDRQIEEFKQYLHKKMFWLLLYKDPKTADRYKNVDYDAYFETLMWLINGFSELTIYPMPILEVLALLETSHEIAVDEPFNYGMYRRFVLEAHTALDKLNTEVDYESENIRKPSEEKRQSWSNTESQFATDYK